MYGIANNATMKILNKVFEHMFELTLVSLSTHVSVISLTLV